MPYKVNKKVKEEKVKLEDIKGFKLKPKNNIEYDGIQVNKLLLIKPSFIEKILRKKTKRKLELYLEFILNMLESDDDDSQKIEFALNDVSRYKKIIKNNYRMYLDKKYYEQMILKIELIEKKLKIKKMDIDMNLHTIQEERTRKSR